MSSQVDICNIALGMIGVNSSIQSLDEGSAESKACKNQYDAALDQILRTYPWPFAKTRLSLALVGTDVVSGWTYAYAYPADCIKLLGLVNLATRTPDITQAVQHEISNYGGAKVILTDEAEAEAIYTMRVTNPGLYDSQFVEAFANLLASKITVVFGKFEMQNSLLQAFYATAAEAFASAMNESQVGPEPDSFLWRARL